MLTISMLETARLTQILLYTMDPLGLILRLNEFPLLGKQSHYVFVVTNILHIFSKKSQVNAPALTVMIKRSYMPNRFEFRKLCMFDVSLASMIIQYGFSTAAIFL